ncbi:hypothetical protein Aph01nite_06200 [Acrocarpospora phusangensis]|uniref:Calcium-binding protein n=1 Tax=Acrocarpospora phusangensis TaxID=1070424 RepID=A0A919UN30_9ACTN|nr:hypothetical protein [Acrocarpospora phusangensis]GIH22310.1 hypothetical protein Aph01nite_06200 [Acrocarpospora phusangensis]
MLAALAVPAAPVYAAAATCQGQVITIQGTAAHESIIGTNGPDVIDGGPGHDDIVGLDGDDYICGGEGNDVVMGGKGDDKLSGGNGRDRCEGGTEVVADTADATCEGIVGVP